MQRQKYFSLSLCILTACANTPRPPPHTAREAPLRERNTSATPATVAAVPALPMPVCTASDPITVHRLSDGVTASPALARRSDGALIAFVYSPSNTAHTAIGLVTLTPGGQPTGTTETPREPIVPDTEHSPSVPALAATRDGYLIAWRQGPRAHNTIALRPLSPNGTPTGPVTVLPPSGHLGRPALLVTEANQPWVAVASPDVLSVISPDATVRTVHSPPNTHFDVDSLQLVDTPAGARVFASVTTSDGHHSIIRALDQNTSEVIARDASRPAVHPFHNGIFIAWPAVVSRHDVSARVAFFPTTPPFTAPPVTVATYRGVFDPTVTLAPITDSHLAVVTVSSLADDAGATLNLSLITNDGRYVGRAPIVTSFLARNGHAAVASGTTPSDRDVLIAVDGRAVDDGSPQLVVTRAHCDTSRSVAPLDLSPGTFVQELIAPEAVPTAPRPLRCALRSHGTFTTHESATNYALDASSSTTALSPSGISLFAVTRTSQLGSRRRLLYATVNPRGVLSPPRVLLDDALTVFTAESTPLGVVAVASRSLEETPRPVIITLRGTTTTERSLTTNLSHPTSAAIAPDGAVYLTARSDTGESVLVRVTRFTTAPQITVLARLGVTDRIAGLARERNSTTLLLTRPDPLGHTAQSLARITVTDGASPTPWREPFADPLGHPRGAVTFAHTSDGAAVVYTDRETLRIARLTENRLAPPRSLLRFNPNGGALLASARSLSPSRSQWLAFTTGLGRDDQPSHAITLAHFDGSTVDTVTSVVPDDADAIAEGVSLSADRDRVVMLYPHNTRGHGVEWRWLDARCTPTSRETPVNTR